MFYLCSHQILDEILQESVEVPSDRDNTQAEVDCDHSGVDERPCNIYGFLPKHT